MALARMGPIFVLRGFSYCENNCIRRLGFRSDWPCNLCSPLPPLPLSPPPIAQRPSSRRACVALPPPPPSPPSLLDPKTRAPFEDIAEETCEKMTDVKMNNEVSKKYRRLKIYKFLCSAVAGPSLYEKT